MLRVLVNDRMVQVMSYDYQFKPELVDETTLIVPDATVCGQVAIGMESSVWFGAVIRGDSEAITIGRQSNIQDLCLLHADAGKPCIIGNRVTLGHGAIVHGATVEDDVMIGIRATVLNEAVIGTGSLIAAGALIPEGCVIPPESVVMGIPGKVVRQTNAADRERIRYAAEHYVEAAEEFRRQHS